MSIPVDLSFGHPSPPGNAEIHPQGCVARSVWKVNSVRESFPAKAVRAARCVFAVPIFPGHYWNNGVTTLLLLYYWHATGKP